jgi:LuxR family transcriptional regulator, maltose regulon positive regulatory protein
MGGQPSRPPLAGTAQIAAVPQHGRPVHDGPAGPLESGHVLLRTKVCPPLVRPGFISRPRLDELVDRGITARLCVINAPAGSGKTTLLARWCNTERERRTVAWLSLEEIENDPVRFWSYVIEAFRMVDAVSGRESLALLRGSASADVLTQVVLPQLINELADADTEIVLMLDDLHTITSPLCVQSLAFFIDHLPPNVHVVIASRVDPPLPLARLRASGDLVEIRIADLEFTSAEATALLNDAMGLGLTVPDVHRLCEGTEGWAAGLYLAGLSLRGRDDQAGLIASLEAGHRHVIDYLGTEVLAQQPERLRTFMLQTSIFNRLTAPLCDAVLETDDSASILAELEHSNQFLIPLDDNRRWYRYHHLFAQLLRLELSDTDVSLIPVLHQRAARWLRQAGDVEGAIHHAIAGGELEFAKALITESWIAYHRRGRIATVERWLRELPEDVILVDPPLALIAAVVGGQRGYPHEAVERWLVAAESREYFGPMPAGFVSVPFATAMTRGLYAFGNVGRARRAARRALEVADSRASESHRMAVAITGVNLYLSGETAEARQMFTDLADDAPMADKQPFVVVNLLAILSLVAEGDDDASTAASLAQQAMDVAEARGVRYDPLSGFAYIALARSFARRGSLTDAEQLLTEAVPMLAIDSFALQHAHVLLDLSMVRHARGDHDGAREATEQAEGVLTGCADPGMLTQLLDQAHRVLGRAVRRHPGPEAPLTDRELVVLRMLATALTQQEIAQELYVSVNTVRSQIQAIYRKTGTGSRQEAVSRGRELGLVPGSGRRVAVATAPEDS